MNAPAGAQIGILGGTFNPPHRGHVALAQHARAQLGLTQMLLMPAGSPPHKRGEADPGVGHRLQMCCLAIADSPGLAVSTLETERAGPSYTVDTLRSMRTTTPEAQLTLLMGADTACTLPSWHEPKQLLGLAGLAVAARHGTARDQVLRALDSLDVQAQVTFVTMGNVDVSSSLVRERVAHGESVRELVGGAVASYIAEHGLYRAVTAGSAQ